MPSKDQVRCPSTLTLLFTLNVAFSILSKCEAAVNTQRSLAADDDLTSMLSYFQTARNSPVKTPGATEEKVDSDSIKKKPKEKCRCEERLSRRLHRHIKDMSFTDCHTQDIVTDDKYTVLRLSNITAGPDPLIAPGDMYFNFNMDIRKRLPRNIDIDVDVYKYMFDTLPVRVPCIPVANSDGIRLGSCTYTDVLELIRSDTLCPQFTENNIPCERGEITPGRYQFRRPLSVIIPNISSMFDVIVKGVYKMRASFVDTKTKEEIGCVEANWKVSKVHRKQRQSSARETPFRNRRWAQSV